ncbi:phycobilisome linker polypeptide [Roseofilum capinflatum]|uniref:Phycobilisome linker polypeptide n=1 Tax=Roseofilum capinflatum BLCC-M114 TaxID=3022440 RepID=A0ABT7BD04_9CYAN|nr:phycobilisome linker polypeptide [Roseofilum capinflatum]MDJ1176662.1 phycobilisome linker polypeptide [Roseofilum capinflatum BLCC-M114]
MPKSWLRSKGDRRKKRAKDEYFMGLEPKSLNQSMVRLQIEGGSYPNQRQARTWLTVRQNQLSQTIQRIHRFGGKILAVEQVEVLSPLAIDASPREDRGSSDSFESVENRESSSDRQVDRSSEPPESPDPDPSDPPVIPESRNSKPLAVEKSTTRSPVYSLFPGRKVNPSRIKPVRRQHLKPTKPHQKPFRHRQLSRAKQRRLFFRSQPLKRGRRRY